VQSMPKKNRPEKIHWQQIGKHRQAKSRTDKHRKTHVQ